MKNPPLVSVVMPVYNSEEYLNTSLVSVLNQSYPNIEFIIIDDGSDDRSLQILKAYVSKYPKIKLIRNTKNCGVTISLNKGVNIARGKYIVRMDADDWSYPTRISEQVKFMERHPQVVVSGSNVLICDQDLAPQHVRKYNSEDTQIRKKMFRYSPFAHSATIWQAEIMKKEKYDESERVKIGEDYDLYFRIGRHGKFANIPKTLLKLRMHKKSVSYKMSNRQSKATVNIRYNAIKNYGYKMTILDKVYNYMQLTAIGFIPVGLRFRIFNLLRRFDFY